MPPLITHIYTADPSAHVFNGKLYIYPSHDRETDIAFNDNGDQYDMNDYHVFSLDSLPQPPSTSSSSTTNPDQKPVKQDGSLTAPVTDHGTVLSVSSVPWASKQLWAPDAAYCAATGEYLLYFPARDKEGVFRLGVAVSKTGKPEGPFVAEDKWLEGSFSIDPAVLVDDLDEDGKEGEQPAAYIYFGGLWGGQLQCYQQQQEQQPSSSITSTPFDPSQLGPKEPSGAGTRAMGPRVARLSSTDYKSLATPAREITILDPVTKTPIAADDHARRFFEAAWCHKRGGKYYLSWSTGDTHLLVYAVGESPWGPFVFGGEILGPVLGWTTHHSIVRWDGPGVGGDGKEDKGEERWWLFYHDCELSGGVDHLRSVKVREIWYDEEGRIVGEKPAMK